MAEYFPQDRVMLDEAIERFYELSTIGISRATLKNIKKSLSEYQSDSDMFVGISEILCDLEEKKAAEYERVCAFTSELLM